MITVVAEREGREETRFVLGHGQDPLAALAARGWAGSNVVAEGVLGDLVLRYRVRPVRPVRGSGSDLDAEGARPVDVEPRRRVAAYAVVVERGALLLTRLAARTAAPGRWTLPGGGLDPGERPVDAVVREVAEETGQTVDEVRLVAVMSHHWVGRSLRGPEDHHAVRLLHVARCVRPTRPVVHDVGGSTSDARWVPLGEVAALAVVPTVPHALDAAGVRWEHGRAQS